MCRRYFCRGLLQFSQLELICNFIVVIEYFKQGPLVENEIQFK